MIFIIINSLQQAIRLKIQNSFQQDKWIGVQFSTINNVNRGLNEITKQLVVFIYF